MAGVFSAAGLKDLLSKYGRVAIGVHLSVSAASITGCFIAIKNNVDVGAVLQKLGLYSKETEKEEATEIDRFEAVAMEGSEASSKTVLEDREFAVHAAVSGGGALALAFLCNKALMPIRIPITVVLTPPIARLLARRSLYKRS